MRRAAVLALAPLVACATRGSEIAAPLPAGADADAGAAATFDSAVMKATHNAYARDEPLFDQLAYHRVRSLELDVHVTKAGAPAPPADWFVYHADLPWMRDTSCTLLSDCLRQIAAFHEAMPRHEVITLFVDMKDDFARAHRASDLDGALVDALGKDAVLTPRDLIERCPGATTLRPSVSSPCRFPTLAELRGKIVVAITGGSLCDPTSRTSTYARGGASGRLAFVAPDLDGRCPIERYDAHADAVFLNMPFGERHRAEQVRARGLVARIYKGGLVGGLDTPRDLSLARASGAQLLATDRVNEEADAWASTTSARGWPFRCPGSDALVEAGDVVTLRARSGDLGPAHDNVFFAYETGAGAAAYRTFLSVPSSHVEREAKGCLVARASDDAGAAAVAVCRLFDRRAPRMIVRHAHGRGTSVYEMKRPEGVSAETPAFLRLAITPKDGGTEVVGEASIDGRTFTTLGAAFVEASLPLRGIGVASHGAPVKAVFGNLTRTKDGVDRVMRVEALATWKGIGGASGEVVDGRP